MPVYVYIHNFWWRTAACFPRLESTTRLPAGPSTCSRLCPGIRNKITNLNEEKPRSNRNTSDVSAAIYGGEKVGRVSQRERTAVPTCRVRFDKAIMRNVQRQASKSKQSARSAAGDIASRCAPRDDNAALSFGHVTTYRSRIFFFSFPSSKQADSPFAFSLSR